MGDRVKERKDLCSIYERETQTEGQTDIQTDGQPDRQTEGQKEGQIMVNN